MNRLCVVIACVAGLWQGSAMAAEGRVADKVPVLESSRVSRHSKGVAASAPKSANSIQTHKAAQAVAPSQSATH